MNTDLNNLIQDALNDLLNDEQMAELEQRLLQDPMARAAYLHHANLHSALKQRYLVSEDTEPAFEQSPDASASDSFEFVVAEDENDLPLMGDWPTGHVSRRRRRHVTATRRRSTRGAYGTWAALLIAGLGLIVALAAVLLPSGNPINTAATTNPHTHFKGVAVVTRQVDAVWDKSGLSVRMGHPLPTGKLVLKSGLAQIEFYQGVTTVLEGPAELVLLDENRAICNLGRIRALVSPQAQGFTIQTPESRVVDLGTELGVLVKPNAPTEVHVFDGEVEVHQPGEKNAWANLTEGKAVRFKGDERNKIKADPTMFVGPDLMDELLSNVHRRRHLLWQRHRERLLIDPHTVLYYDFQDQGPWDRTLRDRSETLGYVDGAIIGSRWVSGRWVGKMALSFKRSSDRVRFKSHRASESMTIAMWAQVNELNTQPGSKQALLHSDGQDEGDVQIHIDHQGKLKLDMVGRPIQLTSRWKFDSVQKGRWVHLVWVLDGRLGEIRSYVNGRLDTRKTNLGSLGLVGLNGPAQLGNWDQQHRNLQGLIDEFLVARRPMSDQEIADLYEVGNPY